MANERITEDIVREKFKPFKEQGFIIEEQKSKNPRINKLLQNASKSGGGKGYPEFIVTHEEDTDFLLVVECKADPKLHESETKDKYADYAVDGVLLYASHLAKDFDVIAIAVSGQEKGSLKVSSFLQLKSQSNALPFISGLQELPTYRDKYIYNDATRHQRYELLLGYNKELNQHLQNHKILEHNRSLLISGIIIALGNRVFEDGFTKHETAGQLANGIVNAIIDQLQSSNLTATRVSTLAEAYNFIKTDRTLSSDKEFLVNLIKDIDQTINSFMKTYRFYDIFGEFYTEFLRYANTDKGLGIVLTPKHITELFCDVAGITKDSVVFDNCCGTGGFLITAMRKMIELADHDESKIRNIKEKQVVGIEFQNTIFPLTCSNMIIHGDGKTNIVNDDCFKIDIGEIREKFHPTIGLLNPPFSSAKDTVEEFKFVLNNLDGLKQNALCIAVLPMSCVLAQKGERLKLKEQILEYHTLEAVMSLPDDVFHNSKANTFTCALVIRAHNPHPKGFKTYFGYWKDDGFIKSKDKGRFDGGSWNDIQNEWIVSYRNREASENLSVMQCVTASDEWCAEAFLETDYGNLTNEHFIQSLRNYAVSRFSMASDHGINPNSVINKPDISISNREWKLFSASQVFSIGAGIASSKIDTRDIKDNDYCIPYLRPSKSNSIENGYVSENDPLLEKVSYPTESLIMGNTGQGSHTYTYLVPVKFVPNNNLSVLMTREKITQYQKIFLIKVIEHNRYRYSYGRIPNKERFLKSNIWLPVNRKGEPDWQFMEDYIKSLPYSANLE